MLSNFLHVSHHSLAISPPAPNHTFNIKKSKNTW